MFEIMRIASVNKPETDLPKPDFEALPSVNVPKDQEYLVEHTSMSRQASVNFRRQNLSTPLDKLAVVNPQTDKLERSLDNLTDRPVSCLPAAQNHLAFNSNEIMKNKKHLAEFTSGSIASITKPVEKLKRELSYQAAEGTITEETMSQFVTDPTQSMADFKDM